MKTKWVLMSCLIMLAGDGLLIAGRASAGQPKPRVQALPGVQTDPMTFTADHHDTSPPLRELVLRPHPPARALGEHPRSIPVGRNGNEVVRSEGTIPIQRSTRGLSRVSTSNLVTFNGISSDGWYPPDPNASVGATQIVEIVNIVFEVFTKTGTSVLGPSDVSSLFSGFGGECDPASSPYNFDPVVLYDKAAGRWVITIGAAPNNNSPTTQCIAISTTSDATGSYHRYAFSSSYFNDYPKFGVWADGYYGSYNLFSGGVDGSLVGALVCSYNRTAMLAGETATNMAVCFQRSTSDFTLLPADIDGLTPPASGEPEFFLELTGNYRLYKFHVDFTTPSNSTFTGPTSLSLGGGYGEACGGNVACIPQEATTQDLDSLGDRLMHRLAYRNFGTYELLAGNSSVTVGSSIGITWFEVYDPNSSTPYAYDAGTYLPDSNDRWMASVAMDQFGNTALGYSASSSSLYPSIRMTGKGPGDSKNVMEAETSLFTGGGAQIPLSGCSPCDPRWGDYTSMAIDPTDDETFVYTNEYYQSTSSGDLWTTGIAVFKLSEAFTVSAVPCSQTVTAGKTINYTASIVPSNGIYNKITFSVHGLPSGATASFSPSTLTGTGSTTMAISTTTSTAPGTYTLTVQAASGNSTQTTTVTLIVAASGTPGTGSVTISGSEQAFCPSTCHPCAKTCAVYDEGSVHITVNGHTDTAVYGLGEPSRISTAATVATALAAAINADCSSPVTATSSGGVVTLTARANGTVSNYSLSAGSQTDDPKDFSKPSFTTTTSGSTLTGGTN
jgi:hypothetical protein